MSKLLRYDAARRGLFVDTEGFVPLRSVASALGRSIDDIIACTETSFIRRQPRFEVRLVNNRSMFVRAVRKNHLVQYRHDSADSQSDGGDGIVGPCRDPRNPSYLGYGECVARGFETPVESTPLPRGSTLGSPIPDTGAVPVTRNGAAVFVRRAADGSITYSQPAYAHPAVQAVRPGACIHGVVENIMDGSAKVNIGSGVILTVSLPDEVQRKLRVNDILDHVRVVRRNRYNVLSLDWPTARVEEAF